METALSPTGRPHEPSWAVVAKSVRRAWRSRPDVDVTHESFPLVCVHRSMSAINMSERAWSPRSERRSGEPVATAQQFHWPASTV